MRKAHTFLEAFVSIRDELIIRADVEHVDEHLCDFLADERQRPREHVHEVGQPVGMRWTVELPYVHYVIFVF